MEWIVLIAAVVSAVIGSADSAKRSPQGLADPQSPGTFVPQYSGYHAFPFSAQPVFSSPHDLTALQQTHVLGHFQHRFQQPRFGPPQFGGGPPGQVLFTQQTEFTSPPQQHRPNFHDQQNHLQQPLIPPQQHQQPPQHVQQQQQQQPQQIPPHVQQQQQQQPQPQLIPQQTILVPQQQQQVVPQHEQTYRTLPPQKTPNGPFITQPGSEPRGPPQTVRFPSQQQSFIPNQPPQFQRAPPQFINPPQPQKINQFQPQHPQPPPTGFAPRFPPNQQFTPNRPPQIVGQPPINVINFRQPPNFSQNNFNPDSAPKPPQIQQVQQIQPIQQIPQPNFQSKIPFNPIQHNDLSVRPQQVNFNPNRKPGDDATQYQVNIVHSRPEHRPPQISDVERPNFAQPEKPQQPNFDFHPTESQTLVPKTVTEAFPGRFQNEATRISDNNKEILFQKSQEQTQYLLEGDYFENKHINEVSPSPRPTTLEPFTTPSPKFRKTTNPAIQEITINLNQNQNQIPRESTENEDIPSQLYIKENRQKQLQELKIAHEQQISKKEKPSKKSRKDKTQEELINEQIQKLLQSHNLEIIDKDTEVPNDSQEEPQLPDLPDQIKSKYKIQLLNSGEVLNDVKRKKEASTTLPPLPELPDHIKKQYDLKLVQKDELFKQFHIGSGGKLVANENLVAPLPGNHKFGNGSTVFLANGQQLEIVKFSKDGTMKKIPIGTKTTKSPTPTTTPKPPKVLFEELAKGVIPPGADFELIKHNGNGQVEKVDDLASAKKVTFVILEEQPDGTVKVQGVKGNGNSETAENESVDSLIQKINDGSLKLPPSSKPKTSSILTNEIPRRKSATHKSYVTFPPPEVSPSSPYYTEKDTEVYATEAITTENAFNSQFSGESENTFPPTSTYESTPETQTPFVPTVPNFVRSSSRRSKNRSRVTFLPTIPSPDSTVTSTFSSQRVKPTSATQFVKSTTSRRGSKRIYGNKSKYQDDDYSSSSSSSSSSEVQNHRSSNYNSDGQIPQDVIAEESNIEPNQPLKEILKDRGLLEMAKFLDQSGLDTILNETGPYTIFIPTDKAFKTLESQLGGSDKAEDKFRENPRLLSGLLLHHVVPGSFRVEDLQDEMTGVSLAGTQLRVNTYSTQDKRAKDQRIVTINGAKISADKRDIVVPQGLAHAVDRVLFPLPVGDILQTLKGDREHRFTKFVKSLQASGLTDLLTGTKTYTVFAPTDDAFSALTDSELDKLLTRREAARTIVLRHIMPGTLYSAGMQYYQVSESMERGQKITLQKELGKVKANSAQVIAANIPSTNGVIHAVDALL